jgi:alpha,alpha-trehalase
MRNGYKKCIKYIDKYWDKITFSFPRDKKIHISMPHQYVAPNGALFRNDQFYWDSYFIILGLLESGKHHQVQLAKGMVDNFMHLYERFGIMSARNRFHNLGISQPPFFTSMVLEVYKKKKDKQWLMRAARIVESELETYWMRTNHPKHKVFYGLSRYCDHYITHATAEHESGWDMTSRFNDRCLDYLPVDLNTLLFRYEKDLVKMNRILKNNDKERYYATRAGIRKKEMRDFMWSKSRGFFFDYNYRKKARSDFYSLAGFYPMWAGLASKKQARRMVDNLGTFEYKGGLANTQKNGLFKDFRQWDYPNGWANQQWIVIKGLLRYGFKNEAERLAIKWLDLNKMIFNRTGKFWEKYDVVRCRIGYSGRYRTQSGFGWTNAVFLKLAHLFAE